MIEGGRQKRFLCQLFENIYRTGLVNRIKDINIGKSTVVCNCLSPVAVKEGVLALPTGYIYG